MIRLRRRRLSDDEFRGLAYHCILRVHERCKDKPCVCDCHWSRLRRFFTPGRDWR